MKKIKMLLPLTTLIIAPILGAQVVACGPSKAKTPMSKQDIYVGESNIEGVAVESKTEYFDPADPKIVIDVAEPYNANYEVTGVDTIWCGPTELAQYDENRDYEITRPDVDSTSRVITFLHPEKITRALYIRPRVSYFAEHTISLDCDPLEGTWTIEGDKAKTGHSFKSEIYLTDIDDPQNTTIIITSITVTGSDGTSRKLIRDVDYTFTLDSSEDCVQATVDFKEDVIDGDVSISCISAQGVASLSIYIGNKLARSEPYCIAEGATSIIIDNPLFLIGCDTYENQTHRLKDVEAYQNDTKLTEIEYNPDATEDILVRFSPCQLEDNIKIIVYPECKTLLTAKECFEQDEWSKVLAMISWAEEDENTFCHFYDTPTKDAKMEDFLGATKKIEWDSQEYDIMVVATNYYHLPIKDADVREETCSDKTALFTFKFMQALTFNSTGKHYTTIFNNDTKVENGNNLNCWYCKHDSDRVFYHELEWKSCIPRDLLNDSKKLDTVNKYFTECFSNQQFVKSIKQVANYTMVSNCDRNLTDPYECYYITDRFFLPTAVQLGMNFVRDASAGKNAPYPEKEAEKPVFDYYLKNYARWSYNDTTTPKPQLEVKDLNGDNVGYYVATSHSNSKDSGTESISSIEVPSGQLEWRLGYHEIDGKKQTLTPCFCL